MAAPSAIFPHDRQVLRLDETLDGGADVAQMRARAELGDADPQGLVRAVDPGLRAAGDLADRVHAAGVAMPAIFDDRDVDVDDVALFQALVRARNAVTDDVIDGSADRLGKAAVVERGRDCLL